MVCLVKFNIKRLFLCGALLVSIMVSVFGCNKAAKEKQTDYTENTPNISTDGATDVGEINSAVTIDLPESGSTGEEESTTAGLMYTRDKTLCLEISNRLKEWLKDTSQTLDTTDFDKIWGIRVMGPNYICVNDCGNPYNSIKHGALAMDWNEKPVYDENLIKEFYLWFSDDLGGGKTETYGWGTLEDLDFLSFFPNLKEVKIRYNKLYNIDALSSLPKLSRVDLSLCQLQDISGLSGACGIETLSLDYNHISDIAPLSNLNKLKTLNLQGNWISEISPLSGLENLCTLNLRENLISDTEPLTSIESLRVLFLFNNQITDVTPLFKMKNIKQLYIKEIDSTGKYTNKISQQAFEQLRKALPNAVVGDAGGY